MLLTNIVMVVQFIFTIIIGFYFLNLLKGQQGSKVVINHDSRKEIEKLEKMRAKKLTEPLSEKTRPKNIQDIIGQDDGIKALRVALCGPNPQHILIYGAPGIGKTAAARVVLEEAKKMDMSPFNAESIFVEIDATTLRFDERGIADPLIGSVHDPIYQGAGAYGVAGVPQPKPGAVTKAHGGVLFIDEIGELHPIQLNKLLKVLEDRKVFLESSYYSEDAKHIPRHIHDIFINGLPADFRLIGATTRSPEEIPPALRSRCTEIFFKPLKAVEIKTIAKRAAVSAEFEIEEQVPDLVAQFSYNGRQAVNMIQTAASAVSVEKRNKITVKDVEWVIENGQYSPRIEKKVTSGSRVGVVNGLAVYGMNFGAVQEIEAHAIPALGKGNGNLTITGIIDQEEISKNNGSLKRMSMARSSVENVLTVLQDYAHIDYHDYNLHVNFPGGTPTDGPSAGITIFVALYSAIKNLPIPNHIAMTGEISIKGKVLPVGGVKSKIEGAVAAGVKKVIISKENYQSTFNEMPIEVVSVNHIKEVIEEVFHENIILEVKENGQIITAQSL